MGQFLAACYAPPPKIGPFAYEKIGKWANFWRRATHRRHKSAHLPTKNIFPPLLKAASDLTNSSGINCTASITKNKPVGKNAQPKNKTSVAQTMLLVIAIDSVLKSIKIGAILGYS